MSGRPFLRFLPLDANGAAIWPPGYVPTAHLRMATPAQTESRLRQHEQAEGNREAARGWAGNTLALPNTPHANAAPAMMRKTAMAPEGPRSEYLVHGESVVWRALELIRFHGRPIGVGELAADLGRPRTNVRASLQPWIARGVLCLVAGARPDANGIGCWTARDEVRDVALGVRAHVVKLRRMA